ncbi:MAG TPA: carboxylating nicotinate-nucleotide diphosphorylase [Bacteroidales bacterium]|nr:carboxylating nicotinate-nucleotide diphosphorylase [Bacteroidales bacterium]
MTLDEIIDQALQEDLGDGDITTRAIFPDPTPGRASLLVKEDGILAGVPVAEKVFRRVDPGLEMKIFRKDGDQVFTGDIAFELKGNVASILAGERLALNFLQRLSGIATQTARMVKEIEGLHAKILDTRKTTPNLRELEKYAVRTGGGFNHRSGLYDMVLIKDNHIDKVGSIVNAIRMVHRHLEKTGKKGMKIEIEVRDFEQMVEVMNEGGVDRILLDNFTPEDLADAVKIINGRFETEASGGITLGNIRKYAESGVDYISAGSLTHHIQSLDMSLKVVRRTVWDDE